MVAEARKQSPAHNTNEISDQIAAVLQGIRYGSIEIVIHDGKVVQIERKEKIRLDAK
jgi:hypothetical protein